MSKKQSPASIAVQFFTAAPIAEADLIFNVVRGIMKQRATTLVPVPKSTAAKPRAKRRTKAEMEANKAQVNIRNKAVQFPGVVEVHA